MILIGGGALAGAGPVLAGVPQPAARLGALSAEDSTYLRSVAGGAVAWRAWDDRTFEEARQSGRLVFVSIGSFTCHWTARTDRETFGDTKTASSLNGRCVNVKVDRFERPDLDRLFRRYAEATGQPADWPLNFWVTPDRLPIRIASADSLDDEAEGGLADENDHVVDHWKSDGAHLQTQARRTLEALADRFGPRLAELPAEPLRLDDPLLATAQGRILGEFDPVHGGFGLSPKFPSPARLAYLGRRVARKIRDGEESPVLRAVIEVTLERMAEGGVHDQLGGGFFRYSLDEAWRRPYFEKLALDQALAAESYLLGHRLTGNDAWAAVVRLTLGYVLRDLSHPEGAYYNGEHGESSPRPDAPPQEGAYYVWSRDDFQQAAGPAAETLAAMYDIRAQGNLPPGSDLRNKLAGFNVLAAPRLAAEVGVSLGLPEGEVRARHEAGRRSLLAARSQRPRPPLDRLLTTQANAALISAFCQAAVQLDEPAFLDAARRAAAYVWAHLWDSRTRTLFRCQLDRAPKHAAVADDYAALVRALLDMHEATGEFAWLRKAADIQSSFDQFHRDPDAGGYFDGRRDQQDLPIALKSIDDAGAFSPNALAALNSIRWSVLLGNGDHRDFAERLLGGFAGPLQAGSGSVAGLLLAADALVHPSRRVILIGEATHPDLRAARHRLATAQPGVWNVLSVEDEAARQWLLSRGALPPAARDWPLTPCAVAPPGENGRMGNTIPLDELDKLLAPSR
ncbi:MAG: thioredoxin domain-containing protein [Verrucomicrobiales bacterium]